MLSEPTPAHRCFGTRPVTSPSTDHQANYCLSDAHVRCPYYLATKQDGGRRIEIAMKRPRRRAGGALVFAVILGIVTVAAGALFVANGSFGILLPQPTPPAEVALAATATATSTATALSTATATSTPTITPSPTTREDTPAIAPTTTSPALVLPTPTPALVAVADIATPAAATTSEIQRIVLTPPSGGVGWWDSSESVQVGLNDSFLYAGVFGDRSLLSAVRFSLGRIPRGAPILSGELQLNGLSDERLNPEADGIWRVQLIPENELATLIGANFMKI